MNKNNSQENILRQESRCRSGDSFSRKEKAVLVIVTVLVNFDLC